MMFFHKRDIWILTGVLLLSGLLFWGIPSNSSKALVQAEIYYQNQLVKTIPLKDAEPATFSLPSVPMVTFEINEDQTIRFLSSDCADQICVHAGNLGTQGQFAACLPNEVVMKIVAVEDASVEVDAVTGN